jgi:hypothetical protein
VNIIFQHSAVKTSAENDKYFGGFYLQLAPDSNTGFDSIYNYLIVTIIIKDN